MAQIGSRSSRVLVFTGEGKGKTTAALGMVLRAVAHGMCVRVQQFIKRPGASGESSALQAFPNVRITQCGCGFVPSPDHPEFPDHREAASVGFRAMAEAVSGGEWDLIVLDEICVAIHRGLVPEEAVLDLIASLPEGRLLVLTGRGATPALIDAADTVSRMTCVKHALASGTPAQRGVEL
ncbi:MAG: cob(I)yrinic acid a,c-diamide adenosyltransferase [Lentisphaerae bacterium]|jgi:cob(I)alamin adenosyltransferase|nr:cob(I)yrinic acid a,c-diamide adenosyltransferase [Lentisphaerota bacterium]MBT5609701.1 cob(I)yrinic acid a,c-diamide adenosyltransferase [Lentisphaerota bacterium]MBT7061437.1 cob(I)yrinic acid a,c-diamide adenosyltransferase [Lentisphaerota bacterium]MBT7844185.1 cob(I)yrinic acid a,c-diamide adenosyltransferase [Lentisphaerota bacterium]